ncbi:DUF1450 domain-containing protein [Natroniella acetigena]|uniref:DUF1450 domain-containing protein n=1 Tax=Natroniella acetigena TaxID=52004 RepID=UPI00200B2D35|nr:DUF1450 domain-containing protein [Natroniella acetigena]MCK8827394.1 DUF1450 domain-containing protein [Natroniella acetigena]
MTKIQFCENNFSTGSGQVAEKIQREIKDIQLEVKACLGLCADCAIGPFALLDGDLIQATSSDELLEKLLEKLRHTTV